MHDKRAAEGCRRRFGFISHEAVKDACQAHAPWSFRLRTEALGQRALSTCPCRCCPVPALLLQHYAESSEDANSKPRADHRDADGHDGHGVGFWQAWAIPGVSSFAFCLFFSKLIAYTFLYWLPYYIKSTPIQGRLLSAKQAGDLSTLFDVGGVAGGIMAGHLSDKSGCSALVATGFTIACVPFLYLYRYYGAVSFGLNVALMMAAGFCVNGPYALITTAVSADLGTHESLAGNAKALATVTAIIDGMGSIGAAIGPMLTGYISERGGFDGVFLMLYLSALAAGLLLIKLCIKEVSCQQRVAAVWCNLIQLLPCEPWHRLSHSHMCLLCLPPPAAAAPNCEGEEAWPDRFRRAADGGEAVIAVHALVCRQSFDSVAGSSRRRLPPSSRSRLCVVV